ncbi:MAG TPA: GatB/YqeY domain-containing protein [Burkholderiaceae bacterium]|nr:GatB/YqeY domain-containing protein [Burkholderiaceae bacterium]
MSLRDRINDDVKTAMRNKESDKLTALRMLTAALKQKEVDERIELTDAHVLALVEKLIKQRKDSITAYEQGGRPDLAAKEKFELDLLAVYLPEQMSEAEVEAAVAAAVAQAGAAGPQDMGKVMAIVKPALAGKADMGMVSAKVKAALSK